MKARLEADRVVLTLHPFTHFTMAGWWFERGKVLSRGVYAERPYTILERVAWFFGCLIRFRFHYPTTLSFAGNQFSFCPNPVVHVKRNRTVEVVVSNPERAL